MLAAPFESGRRDPRFVKTLRTMRFDKYRLWVKDKVALRINSGKELRG